MALSLRALIRVGGIGATMLRLYGHSCFIAISLHSQRSNVPSMSIEPSIDANLFLMLFKPTWT